LVKIIIEIIKYRLADSDGKHQKQESEKEIGDTLWLFKKEKIKTDQQGIENAQRTKKEKEFI